MAKSSKAAFTRIATTVTARYFPTTGATDGFYLDGRLSGRREHRAADITLDREERGFFYAVYAHLSGNAQEESPTNQVKEALDKIMTEVKETGHNIDAEINELAECAVSVVGRIALKHDGMRQPYFAGILVRDSELAAVTMGNGCAYLYRGDVLYPLTSDDFPMEAIDYAGKPVDGLDLYCAGVAGTVRYSNIAQLQMDDCLIVCNRDVMEALGQREVLRMLYEAEDQADAAGMIITAAAAKQPGTPVQVMIGFVENITAADRTARVAAARTHGDTGPATFATAAFSGLGRGRQPAPDVPASTEPVAEEAVPDLLYREPAKQARTTPPAAERAKSFDRTQLAKPEKPLAGVKDNRFPEGAADPFSDEDDDFADEIDRYGRGRQIAFYVIIAAVCIGCIFLIYNMLFKKDKEQNGTTTTQASGQLTPGQSTSQTTTESTSGNTDQTDNTSTGESTTGTTADGTTATTTTATTADTGIMATHTVVANETIWNLAMKYYGIGDFEHMKLIADANNLTLIQDGDNIKLETPIHVGDVLKIPNKP